MIAQITVRLVLFFGLAGAILFGLAGTWNVWAFWWYLGILLSGFLLGTLVTLRTDPSLFQERAKPGPGGKDPHLRVVGIGAFALHWVVAALDVGRFHWSDGIPEWLQIAGLVGLAGSMLLSSWAVSANRFFSSDARIQRDRGHYVITGGPYRFIRHPGYASALNLGVTSALALGSWWAFVPMLIFVPFLFRRLFREEKLLFAELEGYAEYAARVRYRLIPGLW